MTPLLDLRNELDRPDDRDRRDFRRMNGQVQLFHDRTIPGPYTKQWHEHWLRRVLEAQESVRREGPAEFKALQLITCDELQEIRRIWLYEKHEFDDRLPHIFEEVTGTQFPRQDDDSNGLRADDWALLRETCGDDQALFDLQVALLGVERQYRGISRRAGVFEELENGLRTGLYGSEEEAVAELTARKERRREWSLPVIEGSVEARGVADADGESRAE
jgi:DNA sulfur modification protein DndC